MRRGTLSDIANKVGLMPPNLCNILAGSRRPSPKLAIRLEAITGIDKAVWIFEPEKLRGLLDEKFP